MAAKTITTDADTGLKMDADLAMATKLNDIQLNKDDDLDSSLDKSNKSDDEDDLDLLNSSTNTITDKPDKPERSPDAVQAILEYLEKIEKRDIGLQK